MPKTIDRFQGDFRFLSNFFIEPDGTHVEGEYQARKCANASDIPLFHGLPPDAAKRLGRRVALLPDWDSIKISVMRELVTNKFRDHVSLRNLLLDTGDAVLIEVNHWHDYFWGVCNGRGQNVLGGLLMEVRERLHTDEC